MHCSHRYPHLVLGLTALVVMLSIAPTLHAQSYRADVQTGLPVEPPAPGVVLAPDCTTVPHNVFSNCSFESGGFADWITQDVSSPFFPLQVGSAGISPGFGFFVSAPTQGLSAALHGFDGNGPGTIRICQEVMLPDQAQLDFDYRAAWNLTFGATVDRTLNVTVEPSGGGAALFSTEVLRAAAPTVMLDTGPQTAHIDLSALGRQPVRVCFDGFVPQTFTGPAFVQLDNVSIEGMLEADVAVTKTVDNATPNVGSVVTFTITASNLFGGATAVRVTDVLPDGLTFVSATPSQGQYNPAIGQWQIGILNMGAAATLTIEAMVETTDPIRNRAFVAFSSLPDLDLDNNSDFVDLNAVGADLALSKQLTAYGLADGVVTASFLVEVVNEGPTDVCSVEITDSLSPSMTVVGLTTSQGSVVTTTPTLLWSAGCLDVGGLASMTVQVQAPRGANLTNTAEVTASGLPDPDSVPGDGKGDDFAVAAASPGVVPDFVPGAGPGGTIDRGNRLTADLKLDKTIDVTSATAGSNVVYTLTVQNQGPRSTAKVEVTEVWPACLAYLSSSTSRGSYDDATGLWEIGKVKVGETVTLEIEAMVGAACSGTVTNTAEVTASSLPDPDDQFNLFGETPVEDEVDSAAFEVASGRRLNGQRTALGQSYPNPFNPETVVPFSLSEPGYVTVRVYDMLGRRVATLVDGVLTAGVHEVRFDALGLATGMYLIRMEAADHVQTHRILLMK